MMAAIADGPLAVSQHGQRAPPPPPSLAVPQLGSCGFLGRAWRLWGRLGTSGIEVRPLGAQPLSWALEPAASKVADVAAFDRSGRDILHIRPATQRLLHRRAAHRHLPLILPTPTFTLLTLTPTRRAAHRHLPRARRGVHERSVAGGAAGDPIAARAGRDADRARRPRVHAPVRTGVEGCAVTWELCVRGMTNDAGTPAHARRTGPTVRVRATGAASCPSLK